LSNHRSALRPQAGQMETATSTLDALTDFMSTRYFVASRAELIGQGFSPYAIHSWQRAGRLQPVIHGVYSLGRDVETRESVWRAALAAAGPGAALTGRSACELWKITDTRFRLPKLITVAVSTGEARKLDGISAALRETEIDIVSRRFEPGDVRTKDRLELTRAAWALIDLAVKASERDVRFAFLEACRLKLFNERDVAFCFRRVLGRRGAKKLRPLLAAWVPELGRIRSVFEGLFLLAWIERDLPMPLVNEKIQGREVDFYWPGLNLVLELDGGAFHHDPVQRSLDRRKQQYLESTGLTVLRATYKEFDSDPDGIICRVLRHFGTR